MSSMQGYWGPIARSLLRPWASHLPTMQFPVPTSEKAGIRMSMTKSERRLECLDRALRFSENKPPGDREAKEVIADAKSFDDFVKGDE